MGRNVSSIYSEQEIQGITTVIKAKLPEIEGVEWDIFIDRMCASSGYSVRVLAEITTMTDDLMKEMSYIGAKIHEITSGGQTLLELE